MDYSKALYRKNNKGQPCIWFGKANQNSVTVTHGILGKSLTTEDFVVTRNPKDDLVSRVKAKQKVGYKLLSEVKDDCEYPVEEGSLIKYLETYLESDRTTSDGTILPMLAKVYDNTGNKLFIKGQRYFKQPKINGLRCVIGAYRSSGDIFKPIRLRFQSREATIWTSLSNLEDYILSTLPKALIDAMVEENYHLDGELYLPGESVNNINHIVKDPNEPKNKLIQYWCYDLIMENTSFGVRDIIRDDILMNHRIYIRNKDSHLNNTKRFVSIVSYVDKDSYTIESFRDRMIDYGFEGAVIKREDAEYQQGKRNSSMIKLKVVTDGVFIIVDIVSEGVARPDIPLVVLKNDINDATFSTGLNGSFEYQKQVLINKDTYIGKRVFVSFGERSGVTRVPFHIKTASILK